MRVQASEDEYRKKWMNPFPPDRRGGKPLTLNLNQAFDLFLRLTIEPINPSPASSMA
jgi:hypothetical protein